MNKMLPAVKIYKSNALTRLNKPGISLLLFSPITECFHEISSTNKKLSRKIIETSAILLERFMEAKLMDPEFDIQEMPLFLLPRYRFTIRAKKADGTHAFIPNNEKFNLN